MIARVMIAGAALLALAAGSTALAELPTAQDPLKLTEKRFTDGKGNTLVLNFGEGKRGVNAKATDKQGTPIEVVEISLKDMSVCVPKAGVVAAGTAAAKPLCQPLAFVSDGATVKMGSASCTCQVYGGYLYCYGDTCH